MASSTSYMNRNHILGLVLLLGALGFDCNALISSLPQLLSRSNLNSLTEPNSRNVDVPILSRSSNRLSLQKTAVEGNGKFDLWKITSNVAALAVVTSSLLLPNAANSEDELAAKYGNGKGFDSSLVDQTCLVDKCSLQAKSCLADDPDCRKGLTCTAKCMGDNSCITGCMARYGNDNLDNLLKCSIEDNNCIKVAILDGGADKLGEEPLPPAPTIPSFNMRSMEGAWYKVAGFNPNYDCYACQKNTFSSNDSVNANPISSNPNSDKLQVDVKFSMPYLLPDGSPQPPKNTRENVASRNIDGLIYGSQSIGFNEYAIHETMVFDSPGNGLSKFITLGKDKEATYARTAHSEGEMFGLKFWENWYVIGENDPGKPEFKFIYYNGKTRQNTYDGGFVYSRTKEFDTESMKKVYKIAQNAGMNPDQFCKIRNGCFDDEIPATAGPTDPLFRKILASTKISQLLGVEPVAAEGTLLKRIILKPITDSDNSISSSTLSKRPWWNEVGDYLENPNRHFEAMSSLRQTIEWPDSVRQQ